MKRCLVFAFFLIISLYTVGQHNPFRFAFISDTHIGSPDGKAEEDLRRTVEDINKQTGIAFVVLTGDITELGTDDEIKRAKEILDLLRVPYYIIPGNHDTGWSESGGDSFIKIFGNDKFSFEFNGIRFLGCASGPYLRMSDGHVPRGALNWLDVELQKLKEDQPVIFLNHYPIDNGLDNWYEITDRLRKVNTWAILCGHGHANRAMNFEDIPGVMGRSNLRAREEIGGYNLVDIRMDSIIFSVKKPGLPASKPWTGVKIEKRNYATDKKFPRPDYGINKIYPGVKEIWRYSAPANIISTPAVGEDRVFIGDQDGNFVSLSLENGKKKWTYRTRGGIYSSPAYSQNKIVFGSADGFVYCLDNKGKVRWKLKTDKPVLGSPVIDNGIAYVGGSDHCFQSINISTGIPSWRSCVLEGPVVSTPLLYDSLVIFGAWDRNLYALNKHNGRLAWKWNSGSSVRNFSPASCIPVANDGVVYVVAPDRYISAINAINGNTLWRNNDTRVRESIGISADGNWIYGKTMQDTVVAYAASKEKQSAAWKMHAGFGYEHVPSMLIEKAGKIYFGTRNGVVYCIDPVRKEIVWAYKVDNSMVNTVRMLDVQKILVSTMDGKVVLLEEPGTILRQTQGQESK